MKSRLVLFLLLAPVLAFPASAVSSSDEARSSAARAPINVTLTEMKFRFAKLAARRGTIVFRLSNKGVVRHDMRIAGKRSPRIAPGRTITWRVAIAKAGRYRVVCTLPGHAAAGMRATFRVT